VFYEKKIELVTLPCCPPVVKINDISIGILYCNERVKISSQIIRVNIANKLYCRSSSIVAYMRSIHSTPLINFRLDVVR